MVAQRSELMKAYGNLHRRFIHCNQYRELVITTISHNLNAVCCRTSQLRGKVTGEKGSMIKLELGTYTLARSFSHVSHIQSQSQSFVSHHKSTQYTNWMSLRSHTTQISLTDKHSLTHTSSPPQSSQPEQTSNQHRLVQALPPPPSPSSAGQGEHRSSQPQRVHHCWEDREVVRRGRGIVRVVRV